MKKILSFIAVISIIIIIIAGAYFAGWLTGEEDLSGLPQVNAAKGPAYQYNPISYIGDNWQLTTEKVKLNQFDVNLQESLLEQDILDVCVWEFKQEDKELYVWAKIFETDVGLETAMKDFTATIAWHKYTNLAFTDKGGVGLYSNLRNEPPLLIYTADKDTNTLIHAAYYNNNGEYDDENIYNDKKFLIDLVQDMQA